MFDQASVECEVGVGVSVAPAWQRLHGEMKSATRRRCAWDAENARHLREAEAMQLWNHFGYVSILEYLEREHGIDPRTASDRLRVSHALNELPLIEADLEDGTLQYSHVRELTRVVTPETEEEWRIAARGKTCGEVQGMVAGRKRGDGPEDPTDPDLRLRRLILELLPQTLAMYRGLRATIEIELGHRIETDDELVRIILERAGTSPEGASTPAQISVCAHCDRGWQDGGGMRAELTPADLEMVRCDAEHLGSLEGDAVTRKTATISPRKRERILKRDRYRCAVPGCRSTRHLDIHHIVHQEDGGEHEDWNLTTTCSGHHRAHHRGQLAIEGSAPNRIQFTWTTVDADVSHAPVGTNITHAPVGTNITHAPVGTNITHAPVGRSSAETLRTQTRDGLVGLGWKIGIASAAVDAACARVGMAVPIEVLIREALRCCPRPTS